MGCRRGRNGMFRNGMRFRNGRRNRFVGWRMGDRLQRFWDTLSGWTLSGWRRPSSLRETDSDVMRKASDIYQLLPKRDCSACGFESCYECALAISTGQAPPDACKIVGKRVKDKVEEILRR